MFDEAWTVFLYRDSVRELIHFFKYHHKTGLRFLFSRLLSEFLEYYRVSLEGYDAVVAVPLHPSRKRERGYNQAGLLAELVAEHLGLPVLKKELRRVRPTRSQTELSRKERWTNISGAFRIKHSQTFKSKKVLLVDDLLTTGATASEAAWVLKNAGAQRVTVLALAVAPGDNKPRTKDRAT